MTIGKDFMQIFLFAVILIFMLYVIMVILFSFIKVIRFLGKKGNAKRNHSDKR